MNSFFELIQKIPKTVYETEKGISRTPVTNLIENGLCDRRLPILNGCNGQRGAVEIDIVDISRAADRIGPCMRIKKMPSASPLKEGHYFLGDENTSNRITGSRNYVFSLDIWIPEGVPFNKICLQIRYAGRGSMMDPVVWETLQTNALESNIKKGKWERFVLNKSFRLKVLKTELRILFKRGFPPGECFYVRHLQLEEGTSPSFYCNSPGTWYASWLASDISKLFNLYSSNFDELMAVIKDLEVLKAIDVQSGVVLDEIGAIVKEPRKSRNDTQYRIYLKIAIRRNVSNGTIGSIAQIVKLIIGDANDFEIKELITGGVNCLDGSIPLDGTDFLNPGAEDELPASFKVDITGADTDGFDHDFLVNAVNKIRRAGIKSVINIV